MGMLLWNMFMHQGNSGAYGHDVVEFVDAS
jgi:hypothetical protein